MRKGWQGVLFAGLAGDDLGARMVQGCRMVQGLRVLGSGAWWW